MTQEDKELLLKDLCARLPYKVICNASVRSNNTDTPPISSDYCLTHSLLNYVWIDYYKLRPYLRPMTSMTEEEMKKLKAATCPEGTGYFDEKYLICPMSHYGEQISYDFMLNILEWLCSHHFDYRGLIEKGLALKAPDNMYK